MTVMAVAAVFAVLIVDIQLLIAVVIILIAAACTVLVIACCIGRVMM